MFNKSKYFIFAALSKVLGFSRMDSIRVALDTKTVKLNPYRSIMWSDFKFIDVPLCQRTCLSRLCARSAHNMSAPLSFHIRHPLYMGRVSVMRHCARPQMYNWERFRQFDGGDSQSVLDTNGRIGDMDWHTIGSSEAHVGKLPTHHDHATSGWMDPSSFILHPSFE